MNVNDFVRYYKPEITDSSCYDRVLYHYVPLKYGVSDLKNAHLKLSRPTELNDPLDSAGFYKGCPTKDAFFRYFADMLFKGQVADSRKHGVSNVEIWREFREVVTESLSRLIMSYHPLRDNLIVSFCAGTDDLNTDVLLWSHYADNCKGMRIGFQFPWGCFYDICPITYANRMPALDFAQLTRCETMSNPFDKMLHDYHGRMICTKHNAWKYEREYRLITNVGDNKCVVQQGKLFFAKIPLKFVRTVDFGCRAFGEEKMKADERFLRLIWRLHVATGLDLDLFRKAEIQVGRYGYKYVPCKDVIKRFLRRYDDARYRNAYLLRCPSWVKRWHKSHDEQGMHGIKSIY